MDTPNPPAYSADRLTGRTVIVTGAGSGIGRATALRLAREGARVAALDVVPVGLEGLAAAAAADDTVGGRITTGPVDISDEQSVVAAVGGAVAALGGLDAVVNAAAIHYGDHTHEATLARWQRLIDVNLTGTFLMTRESIPPLLESEHGGVVVNFSSTSAFFAHPYMAAYSATKGAIMSFTHAIALEYADRGLRAVSLVPGGIETAITGATPQNLPADVDWNKFAKLMPTLGRGRFGGPEDIAGVVAMLVSDDGRYITGTEIRVDGGTHM
ncbi:SDR family NAD(P)-dependent oxidoreductase [Nocardioides plantarum]|uniref:SDR family NAD(P)-dependent oxidoreductase n=1 Tax=Nocardioides plantarum TaxID=29299 RepID=A0ABV5K7Q9_9ACTN|nr:SDR family NAD(P)-dependent oxidoreductase [Nocardioides plantarum]